MVLKLLDLVLLGLNLPFCLCEAIKSPALGLLGLMQLFLQLIVLLEQLLPVLGRELVRVCWHGVQELCKIRSSGIRGNESTQE